MSSTYFMRITLLPLISFEAANAAKLLHVSDQPIWLGLLATSGGAYAAYEIWHRYRQRIGAGTVPALALGLGVAVVYADAGGNIFNWYNLISHFDKVIHFLSGLATTAIAFFLISRVAAAKGWHVPAGAIAYTAVLTALFLGVGFEVVEYWADAYYGSDFWLGSGIDTLTDLLADMAGGIVALPVLKLLQTTNTWPIVREYGA